ncbi:MAG: AMP-binding protein [Nitrososphaerota archaeon]|jgi:long-chain acyl-CoA synthetase|nr:AMP-binding protein [Nitrososphaerota archaeon]
MKNKHYPLYMAESMRHLKELINFTAEKYGDMPAFTYERKKERFSVSYRQFKSDIDALGTGLFYECSGRCTVAVIGENSYEWILSYFSVVNSGNVILPLDKDLSAAEITNLLNDSGAEMLVFSDIYSDIVNRLREDAVNIRRYINMNQVRELVNVGVGIIRDGNRSIADREINAGSLAVLLYTSGTTGTPKGVMLSHYNLANDAVAACRHVGIFGSNMLVLPLHHSFGFVSGVCAMILQGSEIFINSSFKNTFSDMIKFKPSNMFLVPLLVETFYKKIWAGAKKQDKDKLLKKMVGISNRLLKIGIDVRRLLFKSVIKSFGGNLKLIVSGGAPLDPRYVEGFRELGISVLNGYGITECSPIVSVNRNGYYRDGSVGLVLPCCEVKIAEPDDDGHGEIYVRGDITMMGYYKNEQATRDAFDFNGEWFKTGDIGHLDQDGFLFVSGRKKNLIVLSNGKNVYPEEIENELLRIQYIKEVIVYAEDNLITAEVFLDVENMPDCSTHLDNDILSLNKTLPFYKNIGRTKIRDVEFPKTTTKKIKRIIK